MPKKRFSAEQIVTLLRQIEVSMWVRTFAIRGHGGNSI